MAFDAHANFAITAVTVAPVPALTGTSLTVTAGSSALFPAVPFNCTVYPSASAPISTNAEIVRVTNIVGDVWTITRTQEGSTAMPIAVGYLIANTITKKVFTDIESAMVQGISAAGGSASGGTVQFDNSPTVSFGRAGQTITASAAAGGGGGAAISAGTQSQSTGTVIFSNSNGATFGLNAGTLTLSYTVPGATVFSNSNNVTFGIAGSTVTASASNAQSTQPVAASASNGSFLFSTLGFSNANGVTFGTSAGNIISASVATGLTSQSNQAVSNSEGSFTFQTLNFSNANNVTFGTSAGAIVTASVAAQTVQPVNASAPNGSFNFSTIIFSNSNNVSWSTTAGNGIVASATVASTQGSIVVVGSNGSFTSSQLSFSNANNVSWLTSAGGAVAATFSQSFQVLSIDVTNVGITKSVLQFTNAGGAGAVYFGTIGVNSISAAVSTSLSNIHISAGTTSNKLSALTFDNAGGITFGLNGSVITAVAPAGAPSPVNFSAGTTSSDLASVIFSNSNNVSFGLSGATITASASNAQSTQPVAASASNGSFLFSTVGFSNANGVTFGTSAGSIVTASVVSTSNLYSRFEPHPFGNNSSAYTWSQNEVLIDPILVPYPGLSITQVVQPRSFNATCASTTVGATVTVGLSHKLAIYSRSLTNSTDANFAVNSNSLVSFFSTQFATTVIGSCSGSQWSFGYNFHTGSTNAVATYNVSASTTLWNGDTGLVSQRLLRIGCATSLSWGEYWIAQIESSSANVGTYTGATALIQNSIILLTHATLAAWGEFGSATNSRVNPLVPGCGKFSVTTAAFPASIAISEVSVQSIRQRYMNFIA